MKIILKKVRKKTPFTWIDPIKVEPLELEYLQAVIEALNLKSVIIDDLYLKEVVKGDIIVLNGYNTARDQMMIEAKQYKKKFPESVLIGSGIDIQINWSLYKDSAFDYLVVSNQLCDFESLIKHLVFDSSISLKGVLNLKGESDTITIDKMTTFESLKPNRTYYNNIKHKTRYLLYNNVALVKRSHSCPYACDFCYCKLLNNGEYITRSYKDLLAEMASIKADYYWAVDDVFIHNVQEAGSFIKVFKDKHYKMIVYLRADFIAGHPTIIKSLKDCGIIEVIVGLESIKASTLIDFSKGYTPDVNTKAIQVLKEADISLTALFMVDINDCYKDFKALKQYIKKHQLMNYTFSIFTPLRGTKLYQKYKKDIRDFKCEHYDFLHLVLKPTKMLSFTFRLAFVQLFIFQFFQSKSARQFIYKLLKDNIKRGGHE